MKNAIYSVPVLVALSLVVSAGCGTDSGSTLGDRTIVVPLSYQGDSNWGPKDATGIATIQTNTGRVVFEVNGLPQLTEDRYEGWLAGGGETPIGTGKFDVDATGYGMSDVVLGDITQNTYSKAVLTVEPEPDPSLSPDDRHSIQGPFPAP